MEGGLEGVKAAEDSVVARVVGLVAADLVAADLVVARAVDWEGVDLVAGATVVAGLVVETVETGMLGGRLRRQ